MPSCITTRQSAASAPVDTDSGTGGGIANMTTGTSGGSMMGMPQAPINGNAVMGTIQNTPQQQPSPSTAINNNPMMHNPEAAQQFCLRWNSYPATVATQLAALRAAEDFVDVTLACDGRQLRAHKLVLSACSPYFMQLFKSTPCKHPVIFLKDVGFRQLVALLEFMYAGEVNVSQAELPALLRTAEALQVRGLADTTPNNNNFPSPPKPGFPQAFGSSPGSVPNAQNAQSQGDAMDATTSGGCPSQNASNSNCDSSSNVCSNNAINKRSPNAKNEEEESDSNDSQEFDMGCMDDSKQDGYFNENGPLSQQFDETGDDFEPTIGDNGSFNLSQGDLANELLPGENHTDEDEEVEDDENSIDCSKDFPGFSEASLMQNINLGGTPNGESTGNSIGTSLNAAGGGIAGMEPGQAMMKSEDGMPNLPALPLPAGTGGGRGRNRLARSMWPPNVPYHGPQQCPYCSKFLSNVGNWRKHVLTMHFAREKMYKCHLCPSSFRTSEYLQKHYVRVHNYPQKVTRKKSEQT